MTMENEQNRETGPGHRPERDLIELSHRIQLGLASGDEISEFERLLNEDASHRRVVCRVLMDEAMLRFSLRAMDAAYQFEADWALPEDSTLLPPIAESASTPDIFGSEEQNEFGHAGGVASHSYFTRLSRTAELAYSFAVGVIAASLVAICAGMLGAFSANEKVAVQVEASPPKLTKVAHVSSAGGVLWSELEGGRVTSGTLLAAGDTIRLGSGIGILKLKQNTTLYLEGPVELEIDDHEVLRLRHGRMLVSTPVGVEDQTISTSLASVRCFESSVVGVFSSGGGLEVHAFEGRAVMVPDQMFDNQMPVVVDEGGAIRSDVSHSGTLRAKDGGLGLNNFKDLRQVALHQLTVSDTYRAAVLGDKPRLYWRFDSVEADCIRDEVTGKRTGMISGKAGVVSQDYWHPSHRPANAVLDIGYGSAHGHVQSIDPLPFLGGNTYSVEVWMKPHYRHLGLLATFMKVQQGSGRVDHGMLLVVNDEPAPGGMRFTHRTPAGASGGAHCRTTGGYAIGGWQHVVAVKDESEVRLYIDGEVRGSEQALSALDADLFLLVGQLYPNSEVRPFVGQIDELALYDIALSQEAIQSHFRLGMQRGSATTGGAAASGI